MKTTTNNVSTQHFSEEGFCVLRQVIDSDQIAHLRQLIDAHRLHVTPSQQILYTHQLPAATELFATAMSSGRPCRSR